MPVKSARSLVVALVAAAMGVHAPLSRATTKGLSQIVTPDLQPEGEMSLSAQAQSRRIGNPEQLQAELGLAKWAEIALFQGLSPGEQVLGTEIGLVQQGPWLLTTGFINWSLQHGSPQPLLEGGYYLEHDKFIGGTLRSGARYEALLGWAHDFNSAWRVQLDWQSGRENYATAGITWTPSDSWQVNPALYYSNDHPRARVAYIVASYTFKMFAPR